MGSRNFRLLRGGQFIGDLGGAFGGIAIPATLILSMHASATQLGALDALASGMIPLCAGVAGVVADRVARRPLMIGANAVRLAALLALPLAFALGHPPLWLFFAIAAIAGIASALFDTAYAAFLPSVVGDDDVAAGNGALAVGSSLAEAAGQGLAGALVMLLGAPLVVLVNALTFAVSIGTLAAMRVDEGAACARASTRDSFAREARAGIEAVLAHPVLRRVTFSNAIAHFGGGMAAAVATVFAYRDLHLAPLAFGIVMGVANVGALAAFFANRLATRAGIERTLAGAHVVSSAGKAALPLLAALSPIVALAASRLLLTAAGPVFAVNDATLRSRLTPNALLGRATATARTIVWFALPCGSLAGGLLGDRIGLSSTMVLGAAITAAAALLVPSVTRRVSYQGTVILRMS